VGNAGLRVAANHLSAELFKRCGQASSWSRFRTRVRAPRIVENVLAGRVPVYFMNTPAEPARSIKEAGLIALA
jgi:hypothetical protein